MNLKLSKSQINRFSRQIILKDIGSLGQKKIIQSKVLIIGMGGLGCPVAEFLTRAGVGYLGIVDSDNVDLSNIHRQTLYDIEDLKKSKVEAALKKLKKINPKTKVISYNLRLNQNNFKKIINKYDYIIDGSDNFKTKIFLNDYCRKKKKIFISGAISKFDGHVFSFDFKKNNSPCLRSFFQNLDYDEDFLNCEEDGVVGTISAIIGNIQANEVLKRILNIGNKLNNEVLIINILNLSFRKVKIKKVY